LDGSYSTLNGELKHTGWVKINPGDVRCRVSVHREFDISLLEIIGFLFDFYVTQIKWYISNIPLGTYFLVAAAAQEVHPLLRSLVRSFVHSFVRSFVRSLP
jgi:hypothetical protein